MAGDKDHRNPPAAHIELLLQLDPVHLGHSDIEQQAATAPRVVVLEKRARRRKAFHRITGGAQHESEALPNGGVIVDDEHALIGHLGSFRSRLAANRRERSRRNQHRGPFEEWPPCDSIIARLIESPMPMPSGLVVTNGSKAVSVTSTATPGPVSATEISTDCLLLRRALMTINRRSVFAASIASIAFRSRFKRTCSI